MLRAARRRRSPSRPRLWSGMALQAGARRGRPRFRPAQRVFHRRAATGAEPAQGAPARARAARDRGRHELQATHPDDAGLPPRRPAELRGARDAQPPGIRPGVLRERRGRARGREADGAPVQEPGLPAGRVARSARRHPCAHAHHRHVLTAANAGGVLFLDAAGDAGRGAAGPERRAQHGRRGRRPGLSGRANRARLSRDRAQARRHPSAPSHLVAGGAGAGRRRRGPGRGRGLLMCGVAGIARRRPVGVAAELLERMASAIRHRGPDGFGLHVDDRVGLTNARLSVIDLARGVQPMTNDDGSVFIVYNGEIFNHLALRGELEARGHLFRTRSDTEVVVHAYEQWGERMLERLNGQFAFAIYDRRAGSVFLARDRFGILPLFYSERDGDLYFASEVKAILTTGEVERALDPEGLDEVFTFWAARPPRTPFRGIRALEPGCCARWQDGRLTIRRYYALDFAEPAAEPADALEALDELLRSAVRLRLQADVPVGRYLSRGIDSSIVCALAAADSPHALRTFSVTFEDPALDESAYQRAVATEIRSRHAVQRIGRGDIARVFPDVIRHTETPLVRTAPAPLYLLSRVVREHGIKVVLTGEGSDEVFLGYDLFKEAIIRLLCWRRPASRLPPRLLDGLYPGIAPASGKGDFWRGYFMTAGSPDDPLFSHLPRFQLTARIKDFYAAEFRAGLGPFDPLAELRARLPAGFGAWSPLARAAYLEITTLLSSYLLSSQGDRMAMAHGVEARVPYLDHRLVEFAAALPARSKLRGLREKNILRRWGEATGLLPAAVARRRKQPYRAPDVPAFFDGRPPEYVEALLDPVSLRRTGIFNPEAVAGLVRRCRAGRAEGFRENQALVAILSTELWHREFLGAPAPALVRAGVAGSARVAPAPVETPAAA